MMCVSFVKLHTHRHQEDTHMKGREATIGFLAGIAFTLGSMKVVQILASRKKEEKVRFPSMGFVGIGTINSAVIRGLLKCDRCPERVTISPRNAKKAEALKKEFPCRITIAKSNQEVLDRSEWVVLGTPPRPDVTKRVLTEIKFREDHTVLSFIAGVTPDTLKKYIGSVKAIVQALPLPPAEHHRSTTVMWPKHKAFEKMFGLLGKVVAVNDFESAVKVGVVSCIMGDFYKHQCAVHEWLCDRGIDSDVATSAVSAYFDTFNYASLQAAESKEVKGFDHLVAEQTPGGMNEGVIRQLTTQGNYRNLQESMSDVLRKMTEKK
jgi:pyrroline-5-carboxylate reductase